MERLKRIIHHIGIFLLLSLLCMPLFVQTSLAGTGEDRNLPIIHIPGLFDFGRKTMVVIGDSYATGYTPDDSVDPETEAWPVQVVSENGTSDSVIVSKGGVGFVKSNEGESFTTLLEKAWSELKDPEAVEQIVVCGGYNDIYFPDSSIYYAAQYFAHTAKELFPNAAIYIGMISWNEDNADIQQKILNRVLPAYRRAAELNQMTYISGCEYIYLNSNGAFSSDSFHPNAYGQTLLADYISAFLKDNSFYTGLKKENGQWFWYDGGKIDEEFSGIKRNENGWWYVRNGSIDFNYNGFASNHNGWWYIENGKITFSKNDIIKGYANLDGEAEAEEAWWYISSSKVTDEETVAKNANGWWYVNDGKVDFSYTGLMRNANGWWYCKDGKVDFTYNGFAVNQFGWWYVENGKVTFGKNDILKGVANIDSELGGEEAWWFITGSMVTRANTVAKNANGWWYVNDGKVDFTHTGVEQNENGWWYVKDGKVDFTFNGFAKNANGWWLLKNGKVDFSVNDIIHGKANTDPEKDGEEAWWFVKGGKVTDETTVAKNANGWWYVNEGKVDFTYSGYGFYDNRIWRIKDGKATLVFQY